MAIGAIIGAIIAGGTAIGVSVAQSKRAKDANQEGLQLANIKRNDDKKITEANEKMNRWNRRFTEKQFSYQKGEAKKDRAERSEQKGYDRSQQWLGNSLALVNTNPAMRDSFIGSMRKVA